MYPTDYSQSMDINQVGLGSNNLNSNYLTPQQRNGMMTYANSLMQNQPPATSWGSGLNEMLRSYMGNSIANQAYPQSNSSSTSGTGGGFNLPALMANLSGNNSGQPMQLPSANGGSGGFNPSALLSGLFGGGSAPPAST